MPFLSLVQVLKYWCLSTHTAQFIAQHCKFSSVLERVRRLDDEQRVTPDAFVHAKNTGTRYRRVVKELAVHYETLPEDVKAKSKGLVFFCFFVFCFLFFVFLFSESLLLLLFFIY